MNYVHPKVVISGPSCTEGGILKIFREAIIAIQQRDVDLFIITHNKELIIDILNCRTKTVEIPKAKKSWLYRLYVEYVGLNKLNKSISADIWISMQDITPRVTDTFCVTYCHNPSPFYRATLFDLMHDKKFYLFTLFYKKLYLLNSKNCSMFIVQQNWIKKQFRQWTDVPTICARPSLSLREDIVRHPQSLDFIFPAFPRTFKNFETIIRAVEHLAAEGVVNFRVGLTISGHENSYARHVFRKAKDLKQIEFLGSLDFQTTLSRMKSSKCLIFPSKLETWGLPLQEARFLKIKILAANLPYAHETLQGYGHSHYFPPNDHIKLANLMERLLKNNLSQQNSKLGCSVDAECETFDELWDKIFTAFLEN